MLESVEDLVKEEPSSVFAHCAHVLDLRQHVAFDVLHNDIRNAPMALFLTCSARERPFGSEFVHLGDALVVEIVLDLYLVMQQSQGALLFLKVLGIENFDCPVFLSVELAGQVDL